MYKKPNIVTTMKVRRLEWADHLLRTSDDRSVKKAERPKLSCSDCTENDMKSMGVKMEEETRRHLQGLSLLWNHRVNYDDRMP
jgi:hypothetical protein